MKTNFTRTKLLSTTCKTLVAMTGLVIIAGCAQSPAYYQARSDTSQVKSAVATNDAVLAATTSDEKARKLYLAGWADFENSRLITANKKFQKAAMIDPSFAMAHMMSAWTANSTEGFVKHTKLAAANLDGKTDAERAMVDIIEQYLSSDSVAAKSAAKTLTELHPNSPRAHDFLGAAYADINDTENARAAYKTAIRLDGSYVPGHINLGNHYLTQEPKNFEKAEKHFQKAIALTPGEPNPYDLLGDVHRAQNNLQAAYKDYTKAAELAPTLGSGLQQRGHVNSFLGNYTEARADYEAAAVLEDARGSGVGPGFRVFGAYVNLHEGRPDAAIAELQTIADGLAGSSAETASDMRINTLYDIVLIAGEAGEFATAKKAIKEASVLQKLQADKLGSDDIRDAYIARQLYSKGMLAAQMGDSVKATAKAAAFEKQVAAQTNPRKLEGMHEVLGMSAYKSGDYAKAAKHLAKGNHVNDMRTKYYLARAHEAAGNKVKARELYSEMAVYNFNGPGYAMFRKDILARTPRS